MESSLAFKSQLSQTTPVFKHFSQTAARDVVLDSSGGGEKTPTASRHDSKTLHLEMKSLATRTTQTASPRCSFSSGCRNEFFSIATVKPTSSPSAKTSVGR